MCPPAVKDLSATTLRSLFTYDPETGTLFWKARKGKRVNSWNKRFAKKPVGSIRKDGYIQTRVFGRAYLIHRLIWVIMSGEWPENEVDHIDTNKTNNRWENLRAARRNENVRNIKITAANTSGFKGVTFRKSTGRWLAQIRYNGKQLHIGVFDSAETAHKAYCQTATELFGVFARTS